MAEEIMEEFERCCENASSVQEQLLERILELNKGVEYLRKYEPEGKLNPESFKARLPLVSYEDISAYVERIADGDKSPILSNDPVISFSLSSGTTGGRPKIIPETARCALWKGKSFQISTAYRKRLFPSANANETGLAFFYAGKQFETKSGLKIGAGSTNLFRSDAFFIDNIMNAYSSPKEVVLGYDWRESTYCHLLCGLLQRDKIDYIIAIFAFTIVEAVRTLAKEWRDLCHDLRTGTLNQDKVTDINMRNAVLKLLQPDPELADFVSQVCERKSLNGILQQLWPKAYVQTIGTGAMRPYVPALQEFSGELKISYLDYSSSEATIGINVKPDSDIDDVSFTVVPDLFYFEFIPLQSSDDDEEDEDQYEQEAPVGVGGVEIGKSYELVVTSIAGLYRYKLGDVVKITGFFHKSPQLAFSRRKSALLSINTDKTDEEELQNVMIKASREANIQVSDFTSHGDLSSEPGHYIIYWELVNPDDYCELEKLENCCAILDRSFNNPYMRGRAAGTIGALELVIVKQGTFACLLDLALSRGTSPGQYKTPRCTNNVRVVKLLDDAATARFKSPEFPSSVLQSWKPTFNLFNDNTN